MRLARILLVSTLLSILGCTSLPESNHDSVATPAPDALPAHIDAAVPHHFWWYIRFQIHPDDSGATQTFVDPLIADQLIAPLLQRHQKHLKLWRFHRRWPKDQTGHQFSFIFYTTPEHAATLRDAVAAHPLIERLSAVGVLRKLVSDTRPNPKRSDIEDTSDPGWPLAVQQQWPHYIMGASRMWLGLIQAEAAAQPSGPLLDRYRAVESALTETWYRRGNHAFFHHLSALFGYKPVRVIRRDVMTF